MNNEDFQREVMKIIDRQHAITASLAVRVAALEYTVLALSRASSDPQKVFRELDEIKQAISVEEDLKRRIVERIDITALYITESLAEQEGK